MPVAFSLFQWQVVLMVIAPAVPTVPMVIVASVFVFVDEGQLVCGEGTWGRG